MIQGRAYCTVLYMAPILHMLKLNACIASNVIQEIRYQVQTQHEHQKFAISNPH